MKSTPRVTPLGDSAITVRLGAERSPELLRAIHLAAERVRAARIGNVEDVVPAYLAVTVFYNPLQASFADISKQVVDVIASSRSENDAGTARSHTIPVRYNGIDLESVATATSLTTDDVVEIHSQRTYTVDLLGFVPGWAYLSELDARLQIPRRSQPRPRVAAGSVAIAATQTGIYPLDTPGGWHIIGHTDAVMFDARRNPPALLRPGDTVRFERAT
ncbi:MAG TPA: 5-oxoprolinase subunit PxpB [Gemmatimonadaceae bacterium]|nr:5-oxoprolinase subunit PxpB [Gemmatimonadaceae bacterium]